MYSKAPRRLYVYISHVESTVHGLILAKARCLLCHGVLAQHYVLPTSPLLSSVLCSDDEKSLCLKNNLLKFALVSSSSSSSLYSPKEHSVTNSELDSGAGQHGSKKATLIVAREEK